MLWLAMEINDLFAQALPVTPPWTIASSQLEGSPAVLTLNLEVPAGSKMACPKCDRGGCGVHDRVEKRWRHLNFWQYETYLVAKVPRVRCDECGVHLADVPWARPGSGFTLLFEALVLVLSSEMPVSKCAEMIGEHDTRLWRVIHHYVGKAHQEQDWSRVERVAVDETSRRKGHRYVTNFVDTDTGNLLFMTDGKSADTFERFALELVEHQGDPNSITEVAIDMSPAFRSGAAKHLPQAEVVFDRFHVMQMAGEALDRVRKQINRQVGGLGKGAMWALRGNESNLTIDQKAQRKRLCREHQTLGRAMALREYLQDMWIYANADLGREHFESWYSWARRCRLEPFKELALRLRNHLSGILAYYNNWTTSGMIEAINGKLQLAKKRARGYRNFRNFRAIAYWIAGGIRPGAGLPNPLSMPAF